MGSYFPDRILNLQPLHWKQGLLNHWTTGEVPHLLLMNSDLSLKATGDYWLPRGQQQFLMLRALLPSEGLLFPSL